MIKKYSMELKFTNTLKLNLTLARQQARKIAEKKEVQIATADSEGKILESWVPREKEVLEAVGKQVEVQEHGRVSIPHFGETNEALLVPNSPNCMAVGKRIRFFEYGFTWWPEHMGAMPPPQPGANWWIPNGDGSYRALRCDASMDVPMLPPENRAPILQAYANAERSGGVRVFEKLQSLEAVDKLY